MEHKASINNELQISFSKQRINLQSRKKAQEIICDKFNRYRRRDQPKIQVSTDSFFKEKANFFQGVVKDNRSMIKKRKVIFELGNDYNEISK